MCHLLVISDKKFSGIEKKIFQDRIKKEIKKKKVKNPVIMFINLQDKNADKILEDYNKSHPRAIKWG